MRHRHGLRKLNRTSSHRLAMLRNMANSLLRHEAIKTTSAQGQGTAPRGRADHHLWARSRRWPTAALAFDRLRDRENVVKLFELLGPRYAKRNGGYLRILKFGFRKGDNAPMAYVELMDRPEEAAEAKTETAAA